MRSGAGRTVHHEPLECMTVHSRSRLQEAWRLAGYENPTEAARVLGSASLTYLAHENGTPASRPKPNATPSSSGASVEWLLTAGEDHALAGSMPACNPVAGAAVGNSQLH
jgi:hypothetical protein